MPNASYRARAPPRPRAARAVVTTRTKCDEAAGARAHAYGDVL